jgi:hypothetical protein
MPNGWGNCFHRNLGAVARRCGLGRSAMEETAGQRDFRLRVGSGVVVRRHDALLLLRFCKRQLITHKPTSGPNLLSAFDSAWHSACDLPGMTPATQQFNASHCPVPHSDVHLRTVAGKRGGPSRNRTGVHGFAVRCVTTPPSGLGASGGNAQGRRALSTHHRNIGVKIARRVAWRSRCSAIQERRSFATRHSPRLHQQLCCTTNTVVRKAE